jgi:hypothetical protein
MVNSFLLEKDRYLFFDIFHKNNKLILICPVYFQGIDISKLKIYCNGVLLTLSEKYSEIEYESIEILFYDLVTKNTTNEITVHYNTLVTNYTLEHITSKTNNKLSMTTLFKDDYNLINVFYKYYIKQGVTNFYMYYNGILTDEIKQKYNLPGITLIEWDFIWRNEECKFPHHAQMGQMHQALYKYIKDNDEYTIFCDLDEYLYIPGTPLLKYFENNPSINIFGFRNVWADTCDGKIPDIIPSIIKCSTEPIHFGYRSKCVYKISSIATLGIHTPKRLLSTGNMLYNNIMFHFYSWSGQNRIEITDNEMKLDLV